MTPELQARLGKYLDAIEAIAAEAGPKALDFALAVTRWEAVGYALIGLAALAAAIIAGRIAYREGARHDDPLDMNPAIVIPFATVSAIGGISALVILLDAWTWIAIIRPDLALARDALRAVKGGL